MVIFPKSIYFTIPRCWCDHHASISTLLQHRRNTSEEPKFTPSPSAPPRNYLCGMCRSSQAETSLSMKTCERFYLPSKREEIENMSERKKEKLLRLKAEQN